MDARAMHGVATDIMGKKNFVSLGELSLSDLSYASLADGVCNSADIAEGPSGRGVGTIDTLYTHTDTAVPDQPMSTPSNPTSTRASTAPDTIERISGSEPSTSASTTVGSAAASPSDDSEFKVYKPPATLATQGSYY